MLYHATYRANLQSIKKYGLGSKAKKNWEISESGVVYLDTNPEAAYSFAETAEDVSDSKYESGIIVLAIDERVINPNYITLDKNIKLAPGEAPHGYVYYGVIDSRLLYVVTSDKGVVGQLLTLKRVPAYE